MLWPGRTALHCAIEAHDHFDPTDGRRIDSLRNIYLLANAKADLGKPVLQLFCSVIICLK